MCLDERARTNQQTAQKSPHRSFSQSTSRYTHTYYTLNPLRGDRQVSFSTPPWRIASMLANSDYAFLEPTLGDHSTYHNLASSPRTVGMLFSVASVGARNSAQFGAIRRNFLTPRPSPQARSRSRRRTT